jgi:acyl-CoA hydrolase
MVFVALGDDGRPTPVPQLLVETAVERRRWEAAEGRRRVRLDERAGRHES